MQQIFIPNGLITSMDFPIICAEHSPGNDVDDGKISAFGPTRIDWDVDNLPGKHLPVPQQ
jgi:hypothetical protein